MIPRLDAPGHTPAWQTALARGFSSVEALLEHLGIRPQQTLPAMAALLMTRGLKAAFLVAATVIMVGWLFLTRALLPPPPVAKDYDAQSREERTARRRKVWTPASLTITASS